MIHSERITRLACRRANPWRKGQRNGNQVWQREELEGSSDTCPQRNLQHEEEELISSFGA